jgi:ribosomal protein S13
VERHLPSALEKLLPDLLPKLFTTPSPSFDSQPTPLTPLAQLLLPHLAAHLQPELQTLHADALASGQELRESADAELLDAVEEHKADLRLIKDDGVDTLQRAVTDAFETARVEGQEWAEELGDTTFEVVSGRLDGLSEKRLERALARVLKRWGVEGGWRGKRWQGGRWRRGRRGRYLGRKRGVT